MGKWSDWIDPCYCGYQTASSLGQLLLSFHNAMDLLVGPGFKRKKIYHHLYKGLFPILLYYYYCSLQEPQALSHNTTIVIKSILHKVKTFEILVSSQTHIFTMILIYIVMSLITLYLCDINEFHTTINNTQNISHPSIYTLLEPAIPHVELKVLVVVLCNIIFLLLLLVWLHICYTCPSHTLVSIKQSISCLKQPKNPNFLPRPQ